jgi:outer membrane protein TolC
MRVVWIVMACALAAAGPAVAQPAVTLTLNEAVAEAVTINPEIAAARLRHEAAMSRPSEEKSLPDPMLSTGYNSSGRPWPGAGVGTAPTANIGFAISQQLPYPGKRDLREAIASREVDAQAQDIDAAKLSVTSRVKQAYYRLSYTYAVEGVLARNRDLLDTLLSVSESRYGVGGAAQQDVIKAQTQLSILELQLERVKQERAIREGELTALMARPAGSPIGRPESLAATPFELSLDFIVEMAREHAPMLRRDQIMIDRSSLALDAAGKDYKPDFGLSGGYYYMGSMPPMFEFRFDVQVPLRREKRAAAVAEQRSLVTAAQRNYDATRLSIQSRLTEDYQITVTSARLAMLYRETVLPQARLALESSMASYQTGGVDFLSVLTNFGTVLEYEVTYYDELASYHVAVSRLEETAGTPVAH